MLARGISDNRLSRARHEREIRFSEDNRLSRARHEREIRFSEDNRLSRARGEREIRFSEAKDEKPQLRRAYPASRKREQR